MQHRFFSIVIPAHNEEAIIERTLMHAQALEYPPEKYEIVVVENGSNDSTYEKAAAQAAAHLHVYQAPGKGVSLSRNFGHSKCSSEHDWCIFMDADVSLGKSFLAELNSFLEKHPRAGYGTARVHLDTDSWAGAVYSRLTGLLFQLFQVLFTIHIVKKEYAAKVSYDEELVSGEDIRYGGELSRSAKFFYLQTDSVRTSDRRFKNKGYAQMFFINLYHGLIASVLPKKALKKIDWEVIR